MNFNIDSEIGQLYPEERKLLYDTVRVHKPNSCVELGTWRGMGSTYYTAKALVDNRRGTIHTFEIDQSLRDQALRNLTDYGVMHVVKSYLGDFITELSLLNIAVDFAFLDGPEDGDYTLRSFNLLNPLMRSGSIIIMHDWKSEKCRLMHELLNTDCGWRIDLVMDTKVGICRIIKK